MAVWSDFTMGLEGLKFKYTQKLTEMAILKKQKKLLKSLRNQLPKKM